MIITIGLYVVVAAITFFALTGVIVSFGGAFSPLGAFAAAAALWFGISYLWMQVDSAPMPVAAYAAALILLFLQPLEDLNDGAKSNLAAEQWGIVVVVGLYIYDASVVRWFF
jgi:hypothetical protein